MPPLVLEPPLVTAFDANHTGCSSACLPCFRQETRDMHSQLETPFSISVRPTSLRHLPGDGGACSLVCVSLQLSRGEFSTRPKGQARASGLVPYSPPKTPSPAVCLREVNKGRNRADVLYGGSLFRNTRRLLEHADPVVGIQAAHWFMSHLRCSPRTGSCQVVKESHPFRTHLTLRVPRSVP